MGLIKKKFIERITSGKILGRKSSGTGLIEELSLSEVLDLIGSAQEGDILYRGASAWQRLARGTNGQILTLANNLPSWGNASGGSSSSYGKRTSDFTTNSSSLTNITGMSVSLRANKTYLVEAVVFTNAYYMNDNNCLDVTLDFTVPSGTSLVTGHIFYTFYNPFIGTNSNNSQSISFFFLGTSHFYRYNVIRLIVSVGSTDGVMQLRGYGEEFSGGEFIGNNLTIYAGSIIKAMEVI